MKKAIMFFLIFSLILSLYNDEVNANSEIHLQQIKDNIAEILPLTQDIVLDNSNRYFIGNKIPTYKSDNENLTMIEYDIYPIFENNKIIALANVFYDSSNEMVIACSSAYASALQEYYIKNNNKNIVLVYTCDGLYLFDDDNYYISLSSEHYNYYSTLNEVISLIKDFTPNYKKIEIMDIINPMFSVTKSTTGRLLSVPYESNGDVGCSECDPIGLCWAASSAMIINYFNKTSYNIEDIHDNTGCYSKSGTVSNYMSIFSKYGLSRTGGYYMLSYSDLKTYIEAYKLLFIRVQRTSEGKNIGHMVVGCGYSETSTTKYLRLRDPNSSSIVTVSFPSTALMSTIPLSGHTYDFHYYILAYE